MNIVETSAVAVYVVLLQSFFHERPLNSSQILASVKILRLDNPIRAAEESEFDSLLWQEISFLIVYTGTRAPPMFLSDECRWIFPLGQGGRNGNLALTSI
jgi:hypothetical protein